MRALLRTKLLRLRDDYESPTLLLTPPSSLDIREGYTLRFYTQFPAGGMCHDLLQGVHENVT
jgi:hypothetical protein